MTSASGVVGEWVPSNLPISKKLVNFMANISLGNITKYDALLDRLEMLDDLKTYDKAMQSYEECIPSEFVRRLTDGESPLKVWLEYRNITQTQLQQLTGIPQPTISALISQGRKGTINQYKKLAAALNLDVDDLI